MFLWGVGNAIGPGVRALLNWCSSPEVLFSPIRSAPKAIDVKPSVVVAWTVGERLDGATYQLPEHSLVLSRYDASSPRHYHYALVCTADQPITVDESGPTLMFNGLFNLLSGRPIGASQVTAIVERKPVMTAGHEYSVAFRARLTWPYFIRLLEPISLPCHPDPVAELRPARAARNRDTNQQ